MELGEPPAPTGDVERGSVEEVTWPQPGKGKSPKSGRQRGSSERADGLGYCAARRS